MCHFIPTVRPIRLLWGPIATVIQVPTSYSLVQSWHHCVKNVVLKNHNHMYVISMSKEWQTLKCESYRYINLFCQQYKSWFLVFTHYYIFSISCVWRSVNLRSKSESFHLNRPPTAFKSSRGAAKMFQIFAFYDSEFRKREFEWSAKLT